jgi:hypothetical protein
MPRDFTARLREQQLREEAKALGVERHEPVQAPDYTGRMIQELRAQHDGNDADEAWIASNGGRQMMPEVWG